MDLDKTETVSLHANGDNPAKGLLAANWQMRVYVAALLALSLLATGCGVFRGNHSLQIPLIKMLNDSTMYPGDPFAATLPQYGSMLWRVVAWAARGIPLTPLLICLMVLERLLVIYAAGRAAQAFAPKSRLAVLGAMALFALAPGSLLAQGTVVTYYFEQTGLSIAFILLAIAAFYSRKPAEWAVWLALALNVQSMYGVFALTYFSAAFALDPCYRRQMRQWLPALALFLVLSIPNIALTLSDFGKGTADNALWVAASRLRFAPHLYPLTWGEKCFLRFGVFTALVLGAVYQNRQRLGSLQKHAVAWAAVSLVWIAYAFIAAHIERSSLLIMQPGRATDIWWCFGSIALVSACAARFEDSTEHRHILLAALIAGALMWQLGAISVCIILVSISCGAWKRVWTTAQPRSIRLLASPVILVSVAIAAVCMSAGRIADAGSVSEALIKRPDPTETRVAEWAKANTSKDAVFLIDLFWADFRAVSERPVFTTWKDGSAILWDRSFVSEWAARLRAVGVDVNDPELTNTNVGDRIERGYDSLDDQDIMEIMKRYPIDYWVVAANHKSGFPVVFRNDSRKVLAVRQPKEPHSFQSYGSTRWPGQRPATVLRAY